MQSRPLFLFKKPIAFTWRPSLPPIQSHQSLYGVSAVAEPASTFQGSMVDPFRSPIQRQYLQSYPTDSQMYTSTSHLFSRIEMQPPSFSQSFPTNSHYMTQAQPVVNKFVPSFSVTGPPATDYGRPATHYGQSSANTYDQSMNTYNQPTNAFVQQSNSYVEPVSTYVSSSYPAPHIDLPGYQPPTIHHSSTVFKQFQRPIHLHGHGQPLFGSLSPNSIYGTFS